MSRESRTTLCAPLIASSRLSSYIVGERGQNLLRVHAGKNLKVRIRLAYGLFALGELHASERRNHNELACRIQRKKEGKEEDEPSHWCSTPA